MTTRSFTPDTLVVLPTLKTSAMLALLASLESAAKHERRLKSTIAESLGALLDARDALQRAFFTRAHVTSRVDDPRPVDQRVDEAWSAFESWLAGWKRCRRAPRRAEVEALYQRLFADGLKFLSLKFREEWAESSSRIALLEQREAKQLVNELGGAVFIDEIVDAQRAYGEVLGITKASSSASPEPIELRPHFDRAQAALRDYVLVVAGYGATPRRGARALADRLLAPIDEFESARRGKPNEPVAPPTPA
jgi:hypothetical protein